MAQPALESVGAAEEEQVAPPRISISTFREHLEDDDLLLSPSASRPSDSTSSPKKRFRKSVELVNILTFWKRLPTNPPQDEHEPPPTPISSTARTVYILLTGQIPTSTSSKEQHARLNKRARHVRGKANGGGLESKVLVDYISDARLSEAEAQKIGVEGVLEDVHDHTGEERGGARQETKSKPVPHVSNKSLKKAKRQLVDPVKARKIVTDLKRMEMPPSAQSINSVATPSEGLVLATTEPSDQGNTSQTPAATTSSTKPHPPSAKGFALPPLSTFTTPSSSDGTDLPYTLISLTSPGNLGAIGAEKTGAYTLLADISGALVKRSHAQDALIAPLDRISIFIWYWGFELTIPPSEMKVLSNVHSVQSTFFMFLSAMIIAGGAPELVPYTRYISSYLDMEWGAIKSQDRGRGVVVAATWLLPVALVPRPWDFSVAPKPSLTSLSHPKFSSFATATPSTTSTSPTSPASPPLTNGTDTVKRDASFTPDGNAQTQTKVEGADRDTSLETKEKSVAEEVSPADETLGPKKELGEDVKVRFEEPNEV